MLITKSPIAQPPFILNNLNAAQIPFIIRGASGQSANLQEWQDSTNAVKGSIGVDGYLRLANGASDIGVYANGSIWFRTVGGANTGIFFPAGSISMTSNGMIVTPQTNGQVPFTVRGVGGQTGDLQRWQTNTPTTLSSIDNLGRIQFPNVEAITASAGAAAGTSPPAPVPGGNDIRGYVTFGTGTGPSAGIMCHVAYTTAFAAAPVPVVSPTNAATAALGLYALNFSTTGFDVAFGSAPAASQANTTYGFSFTSLG